MESVELPGTVAPTFLSGVRVEYSEGDPEVYALPLAFAEGPAGDGCWPGTPSAPWPASAVATA